MLSQCSARKVCGRKGVGIQPDHALIHIEASEACSESRGNSDPFLYLIVLCSIHLQDAIKL